MPTDTERREAARRLRGIKDTREGCGHELCCDLRAAVFDSDYRCTDLCDECEVAVLNYLADLIEPEPERTCRPTIADDGIGAWGAYCSECGYRFAGPEGNQSVIKHMATRRDIMPRYCPNCGTRVVVDDADR